MRIFTDVKKGSNLNIHETPTECPKISTFGHTKGYQYPKATNLKRNLRERPCPSCLDPRTMTGITEDEDRTHTYRKDRRIRECDHSNREVTTTTAMGNLNRAPQPAYGGTGGGVVKSQ